MNNYDSKRRETEIIHVQYKRAFSVVCEREREMSAYISLEE